jgi:hypothetical protein
MTEKRKRKIIEQNLGGFLRQYARKAQKNGSDPNDRWYDREIEERIKRMKPEDLDRLMRGEEDDSATH